MFFRQDVGEKIYTNFRLETLRRFFHTKCNLSRALSQDSRFAFIDSFQTICRQSFAYFLTRYCVCNTINL